MSLAKQHTKYNLSRSTNPCSGVSEGMHRMENTKGGNSSQPSFLEENQEPILSRLVLKDEAKQSHTAFVCIPSSSSARSTPHLSSSANHTCRINQSFLHPADVRGMRTQQGVQKSQGHNAEHCRTASTSTALSTMSPVCNARLVTHCPTTGSANPEPSQHFVSHHRATCHLGCGAHLARNWFPISNRYSALFHKIYIQMILLTWCRKENCTQRLLFLSCYLLI